MVNGVQALLSRRRPARHPARSLRVPPALAAAALTGWALACGVSAEPPPPPTASPPPASPTVRQIAPTATASPPPAPTAIPQPSPGTLDHFASFSIALEQALLSHETGFLAEVLEPSIWNCLGDETIGVCQGRPSGAQLEGIPVAQDWQSYQVIDPQAFVDRWKRALASADPPKLAATAFRFGDNPLMPGAAQAFLAVIRPERAVVPTRILFFEAAGSAYRLMGELEITDPSSLWLQTDCLTCFDEIREWPRGGAP